MGLFKKRDHGEELYQISKSLDKITNGKKELTEREHKQVHKLLEKRAEVMSDFYGTKISPVFSSYKESKKYRDQHK